MGRMEGKKMKNKVAVYSTLGARNYAKNVRQKDDFYATPL